MQDTKHSNLSNIAILRDLTSRELADIDRQLTMASCRAGKIFYMPEESGEVLYLLKRGRVQLYHLGANGRKLVVATLGPGAIFGEMSLVGQGMHNTFAQAASDCLLCVMGRPDVERLMRDKPEIAFRFLQAMTSRVKQLETQLAALAFESVPMRLATLLLSMVHDQDGAVIAGYSHQDLAEQLGTYRETVTQTLNEWKLAGLVEPGRKRIAIRDSRALEALARGSRN